jgi:hypothetical protein
MPPAKVIGLVEVEVAAMVSVPGVPVRSVTLEVELVLDSEAVVWLKSFRSILPLPLSV